MKKTITVSYAQTILVEVNDTDTVEQILETVKNEVSKQLYPQEYSNKYLEFIIINCPEMPNIEDEMLD